ncbi:MAG: lamin tail domain-containing protein [Anaerolineae bacterium]|nr:lamin tail domain-containing protein [Anaerolineae bacterium]MDW8103268.1 lamin tail domain-containing protein [Anaerolineae bacterium]
MLRVRPALKVFLPSMLASVFVVSLSYALAMSEQNLTSNPTSQSETPPPVVINEVAWAGTVCSHTAEWIELYNNTNEVITLNGWTLRASDGSPSITLRGTISPHGFFLLERSNDNAIADIPADQIFTGALSNEGEVLELRNASGRLVDTANGDGGSWPAGQSSPERRSMERFNPAGPDISDNWRTNNGVIRNGIDACGYPISGTPKALNSASYPNLVIAKQGPAQAKAGELITYTILLSNAGVTGIEKAFITDVLPDVLGFIEQQSPFTFTMISQQVLRWDTSYIPGLRGPYIVTLTVQSSPLVSGDFTNSVTVTADFTETDYTDNTSSMAIHLFKDESQLKVNLMGPEKIFPGGTSPYTVTLENAGIITAESVLATGTLPFPLIFLNHSAPYTLTQPSPGVLVWEVGSLPPAQSISWNFTVLDGGGACGSLTTAITVSTISPESILGDNVARHTTNLLPKLVIDALLPDGYQPDDDDEAFRLWNLSPCAADLSGWCVTDREGKVCFPGGASLPPGQAIWCAKKAQAFKASFGFLPDWEYGADTSPEVPQMSGKAPAFSNSGDEMWLLSPGSTVTDSIDALVYGDGNTNSPGWSGPAVQPYKIAGGLGLAGQILFRKRDELTGLPLSDANTATDWAQDPHDPYQGRRVLYPGWELDRFFYPVKVTETARLTVAIGPDHLYETIARHISAAQQSLKIAAYSLDNIPLALSIAEKARQGISVTILLEGEPVGGLAPENKQAAKLIHDAGGQVYFMVGSPRRYRFHHAKYIIIDGRVALLGSENLSERGMPSQIKPEGLVGYRGAYLITDAPSVVRALEEIFAVDADPSRPNLASCQTRPYLCTPPPVYSVYLPLIIKSCPEDSCSPTEMKIPYSIKFPEPLETEGTFRFTFSTAPENALRQSDGLFGLLNKAGEGDVILSQQLYEYMQWGDGPNLRLQALVNAARRGAKVRILLDEFFYREPNSQTINYLQQVAHQEGLDLEAKLASPMGMGIHNKMVLARIGGKGYVWIGSINGSEVSFKVNREVGLLVESHQAYEYLASLFWTDWAAPYGRFDLHIPLVLRDFRYPADLLISEVLYDAPGEDEGKEWVEIYNPTGQNINLSGYKLGDAQGRGLREGMYRFPDGSFMGPREVRVIAWTASGFYSLHGRLPDFEIEDTNPNVPNMIPYTSWSTGPWGLRNLGDEVVLLGPADSPVDVAVYGDGSFPGVKAHPGVSKAGRSLERFPPDMDTDDCARDFREASTPSPGHLPDR